MALWNYADVWEIIADAQPQRPALIQGEREVRWEAHLQGYNWKLHRIPLAANASCLSP